jgi:hypothetical protein
MKAKLASVTAWLGLTLFTFGCSSVPPKPQYCAARFQPETMSVIHLMPTIDARPDKALTLNPAGVQQKIVRSLTSKRYRVVALSESQTSAEITLEDLNEANQSWLGSLGPADAEWILLVAVEDLSRKLTFGSTGNAEVRLCIVDKKAGEIVWRDKALGQAGQGGLVGMMMISMMEDEALSSAVNQLTWKFPKVQKQK